MENEEKTIRIQTHSGRFHVDEVAAISLLTNYYSYKNYDVSVIRSRDSSLFDSSDILIDVGMKYDPETLRFDHHQKDFAETWNSKIPLSSAGLVWRHYGSEIIEIYLDNHSDDSFSNEAIEEIKNLIYQKVFLEIDAYDNGIELPSYKNNLNLHSLISSLNEDPSDKELQNKNFLKAVELIGEILNIRFREIINSYFDFSKDFEIVKKMDLDKEYLFIDQKIPTFFKCLNRLDPENKIKFVIFYDSEKEEYTIKARKKEKSLFELVCPLASEEYLKENLDNPNELLFIHKALFIAKTTSFQAAEDVVKLSLEKKEGEEKREEKREEKNYKGYIIAGLTLAGVGILYTYLKKD